MSYTNQKHVFHRERFGTKSVTPISVSCPVTFPVKKMKFNFAYAICGTEMPNFLVTANLQGGTEIIGCLNRFSRSGEVTNADLSGSITAANFNAVLIPNNQQMTTALNMTATITGGGINGAGISPEDALQFYITPAQIAAANIVATNDPLTVVGAIQVTVVDLTGDFPGLTATLTQANFDAATIANTNNPLTVAANIPLTVLDAGNVIPDFVSLQVFITPAQFVAALGQAGNNPLRSFNSLPITIVDNSGLLPVGISGTVSATQFNAADIVSTNNPLVANADIGATVLHNLFPISIAVAQFDAAAIANTNDPLTSANPIAITVPAATNIFWAVDSLSDDKALTFIYETPQNSFRNINMSFENLADSPTIADVLIHIEFLGN